MIFLSATLVNIQLKWPKNWTNSTSLTRTNHGIWGTHLIGHARFHVDFKIACVFNRVYNVICRTFRILIGEVGSSWIFLLPGGDDKKLPANRKLPSHVSNKKKVGFINPQYIARLMWNNHLPPGKWETEAHSCNLEEQVFFLGHSPNKKMPYQKCHYLARAVTSPEPDP